MTIYYLDTMYLYDETSQRADIQEITKLWDDVQVQVRIDRDAIDNKVRLNYVHCTLSGTLRLQRSEFSFSRFAFLKKTLNYI